MLQEVNGTIVENAVGMAQTGLAVQTGVMTNGSGDLSWTTQPAYYYYRSYPVYVYTDKTKKAIDILKALQADKQLECKSVPKFIELVEKIVGLL